MMVLAITMNSAAGTPLPDTSAMTMARWVWSIIKSRKVAADLLGRIHSGVNVKPRSGPERRGKILGSISRWMLLATFSSAWS